MNTEITDTAKFNGWVCYDAGCGFCVRLAERFRGLLAGRRFELVPLQAPWVKEKLRLDDAELLAEMRLLKADGTTAGGADALLEMARAFWWAWPMRQLGRIPAVMKLFRDVYRWVARSRGCANGACEIEPRVGRGLEVHGKFRRSRIDAHGNHERERSAGLRPGAFQDARHQRAGAETGAPVFKRSLDVVPLFALPLGALICRPHLTPWIFMWAMAFALFAGCKWLTYRLALAQHRPAQLPVRLGYLFAWPGMDARTFLEQGTRAAIPRAIEWAFAVAKAIFGIFLLCAIARTALPAHPLLAGWLGMTSVVFMLHFGLFHLLSLAWRRLGVNATPVMQNPLMAKSLADFWGARWNTAFNELAFRFTFRALRRLTTPAVAMLAVFGLSGLIHELVISLPAGGGYGLPTLYFLAQGAGVLIERSQLGKRIGLGRGWRGWLFTLCVTAGPAFWLFHPPFIHNVILPMLTAIGAT